MAHPKGWLQTALTNTAPYAVAIWSYRQRAFCERAMDDGACPAIFGGGWDASSEIGCTLQGQSRDEKRASRILAYSTVAPIT